MRLSTASIQTNEPALALVFGTNLGTEKLVSDLEKEGFEVEVLDPGEELKQFKRWKAPEDRLWVAHPGWTDWAQRPEWAQEVLKKGGAPVGPAVKTINLFSHLLNFFSEAQKHGIPNALLHPYPLASIPEAENAIHEYPVVLKNMRSPQFGLGLIDVGSVEDLYSKGASWVDHLQELEGDSFFMIERFVEGARLVRIPFTADEKGEIRFYSAIEHSLQMEYRAYVPFCPPANLAAHLIPEIHGKSEKFLQAIRYLGFGSLDFLVDGSRYYLVGGHCGIKRDSWLWERVDGVNAVSEQLRSMGLKKGKLPKKNTRPDITAAMVFLRAEDPIYQLPSSGKVLEKEVGDSSGEWFWTPLQKNELPAEGRDLLGVWIGEGKSLKQVFSMGQQVLEELWLHGTLLTNQKYLVDLLAHSWIKEGAFYLGFLQHEFIPDHRPPLALLQFAADLCATAFASASDMEADEETGWQILHYQLKAKKVKKLTQQGNWKNPDTEEKLGYSIHPVDSQRFSVRIGSWCFWALRIQKKKAEDTVVLKSLVTGTVKRVESSEKPVVIIESLHRWVTHTVSVPVQVNQWKVKKGDRVRIGQVLAELRKVGEPQKKGKK